MVLAASPFCVAFTMSVVRRTSDSYAAPPASAIISVLCEDGVRGPAAVIPSVGLRFTANGVEFVEDCVLFCKPVFLAALPRTTLLFSF